MRKWEVKVCKYRGQFKVGIPKELVRLGRLNGYEFVEMSLDSTGKIIIEAFDARGYRKVEGRIDQVGFN
jgi:hypothetical protein